MKRRRGFFLVDAIIALGLLTAVGVLLVVGRSAAQRATRAADDHRAAVRIAERYLAEQNGPGENLSSKSVVVSPLHDTAPQGWQWVSVRATVNRQTAELVALVRRPS